VPKWNQQTPLLALQSFGVNERHHGLIITEVSNRSEGKQNDHNGRYPPRFVVKKKMLEVGGPFFEFHVCYLSRITSVR
jgi:hypothetical protein